ncbi:tetratricopeptide repeat-containing sensor histidine kinase [Flavivirga jejuensis]|uniref:histidine kinase n=1 Tax=Flavivirga jejuensis TaxID=870487 RepID=A0ABT8WUS2_9FLAO|nr:tetratricopeptide repeat-containing sensor histidine kinase [Flavivirga jejuensis]MDO5976927.1 tetratricopeptide repeat protein [Flavivirga jejuensis]
MAIDQNLITNSGFIYKKIGLIYYRKENYPESIKFFKKSIQIDSLSKNAADSHFNISLIYRIRGSEDSLIYRLNKAVAIYKTLKDSDDKFSTFSKAGILYKNAGRYDSAIKHLLWAYEGYDQSNNLSGKAHASNILGSTQRLLGNLDIAEQYYKEALHLNNKLQDTVQVSFSYVKIANLLKEQKKYNSAIAYYEKGIQFQDQIASKKEVGKMLNNLASVYYLLKNYAKANTIYLQALALKKQENNTIGLAYTYNELAILSIHNERLKQARAYLDSSTVYLKNTNNKDVVLRKYEIEALYSKKKGDYKNALTFQEKYSLLYKTIFTENQTKIIQELQEKFESKKKQVKIIELSSSNKNKVEIINTQKRNLRQKNILLLLALVIFLLVLLSYFYLKQRQKSREKELELQQLESVYKGQEIIKKRISKDLHDIITTSYDGIRLKILALPKSKNPDKVSQIIIDEIKEINQEIRLISHRLSPLGDKIQNSSLREIITSQLSEFQYYRKIFINVQLPLPEELDYMKLSSQTNFYGIILEALSNIEKHSQATEVKINYKKQTDGHLLFSISDNGVGFKTESNKQGIGLFNMKQRTQLLFGNFQVKSTEEGTLISLDFPIKENIK